MFFRFRCHTLMGLFVAFALVAVVRADQVREDFEDGVLFDGMPVRWEVAQGLAEEFFIESGKLVVETCRGCVLGESRILALRDEQLVGDVTVRARLRAEGTGPVGVLAQASVEGRAYASWILLVNGVFTLRLFRFDPENPGGLPLGAAVPLPPAEGDYVLELRTIGDFVESRAWPVSRERPINATIQVADDTYRDGHPGLFLQPRADGDRGLFCDFEARQLSGVFVGGDRPVRVHEPEAYDPSDPVPLVLSLHAATQDGCTHEDYVKFVPLVDTRYFLYAHPDGTRTGTFRGQPIQGWNAGDDFGAPFGHTADDTSYLAGVIDEIRACYNVDPRRIFIVGHSSGGTMAYRMACHFPDLVAAIASLSGPQLSDPSEACTPSEAVHVLRIHGTDDRVISYGGGAFLGFPYPGAIRSAEQWAEFNGCSTTGSEAEERLDLDKNALGVETRITRYTADCRAAGSAELWTIVGGGHVPRLIPSGNSTSFAVSVIDWLLAHPKEATEPTPSARFRRGECNDDGTVDISDAIYTLGSLFLGEGEPGCDDACDSNDDGAVDTSDPITTLGALFLGDLQIPAPGIAACGVDPTDDALTCETAANCTE